MSDMYEYTVAGVMPLKTAQDAVLHFKFYTHEQLGSSALDEAAINLCKS